MYSSSTSSESISGLPMLTAAQLHHQQYEVNRGKQAAEANTVARHLNYADASHMHRNRCRELAAGQGHFQQSLMTDNIETISGTHSGLSRTNTTGTRANATFNQPQPVAHGLNLAKVLSNLDNQDPFQAFVFNPDTAPQGSNLFEAIACKDLPCSIRQLELDWKKKQIRNMLGIIYQDLQVEDRKRFNNICSGFKAAESDYDKEYLVGRDLTFLLHKYGKKSLFRQMEVFTECCRKVWQYYHPGHAENPTDEYIFVPSAEACYMIAYRLVNELTRPNQEWAGIVCDGLYFKDTCSALGACLNIKTGTTPVSEKITETFGSIFPPTGELFSYPASNGETESMNSRHSNGFVHNLLKIFCCDV